jgi:hypothetical protein
VKINLDLVVERRLQKHREPRSVDLNALDEAFQFGGDLAADFLDALDRLLLGLKN